MDEDLKITKSGLTRFGTFKLNLYWAFYNQIQWLKTLFTFRTKEQRALWKAEMASAKNSSVRQLTEKTTWSTPRIAMIRSEELRGDAAYAMLKSLFKSSFSPRTYFKDMFSGWNIGWQKRAEAIYRGDT